MKRTTALMIGMTIALGFTPFLQAEEDAQITQEQTQMDETVGQKPAGEQAKSLAEQFKVEPATVDDLRAKNRGWGEIGIELSMAQRLTETDPTTYPTMQEALAKLETMRADGTGWGKIAKDLGMNLGEVVSASRHARNAMRAERREIQRQDKMEKRHERREKMKSERSERMPRSERPPRPARSETPTRSGS